MTAPRFYPCLTAAQLEAVREAMASRLAGPLEGADQRERTYEDASDALYNATKADVAIFLNPAEAMGLIALIDYVAQSFEDEPASYKSYFDAPTRRAVAKLRLEMQP